MKEGVAICDLQTGTCKMTKFKYPAFIIHYLSSEIILAEIKDLAMTKSRMKRMPTETIIIHNLVDNSSFNFDDGRENLVVSFIFFILLLLKNTFIHFIYHTTKNILLLSRKILHCYSAQRVETKLCGRKCIRKYFTLFFVFFIFLFFILFLILFTYPKIL